MKPIICADDDADQRMLNEFELHDHYKTRVDCVANGQELVDKVRDNDYCLIVTDYQMPVLDGLDAVRKIRTFNQKIPILMISGSNIEKEALNAGVSAYIEKPVFLDQLTKRTDELLKNYL